MKESKYKKELVEFDIEKAYEIEEVMGMLKSQPKRKFTESVDVAVKLGIDPKKSDQNVRGSLTLPNSLGKSIVVAAFVEGDKAEEAKKAGATEEEIKIAVMIAGVVSLNSTVLYGNQYSQEKLKKMLE